MQFKEFFREPEVLFWAIGFPIALAFLLGIAIDRGGPAERRVAVVAGTAAEADSARVWLESLAGARPAAEADSARAPLEPRARYAAEDPAAMTPRIEFVSMTEEEAVLALKRGKIALFVERAAREGGIRYRFDPRSGEAQLVYLALERALHRGAGGVESEVAPLEITGTRYIDFLVPGLLAMGIMGSAMWGIGWSLIEMRMKKLLRRMAATPMRKSTFLGSFFVTRLIINAIEFGAIFLFAFFYFGVRVEGSVPALVLALIAGNLAFAGLAVFTASRTKNSRVGNGLINAVTFPMTLLSGIFFSYHNFPEWAVPIVRKLPLTLLADSIRSIFTEGAGFGATILPTLALALIGLVFFAAGMRIFRWY
ncbi:MAG TPA: ABC transporter permease [Candidatus Eisenbacteria bacterium]|uniref:Transport permease protein n=1 Tax=Eiseniibacteriota bacterium TaxID=2212470 RepID=A0A7V2F4B5_UNCEI|nr:ABC transporter permease [Candidatus Eisenbacteria bacterium]